MYAIRSYYDVLYKVKNNVNKIYLIKEKIYILNPVPVITELNEDVYILECVLLQ